MLKLKPRTLMLNSRKKMLAVWSSEAVGKAVWESLRHAVTGVLFSRKG